ncbi:MAG: OsmC family protein [Planctomycetales bacterium]|nr:OsmC family protein [Planctomycetales bacterium]
MDRDALKSLQAPLKQRYQANPEAAIAELHATGIVNFSALNCRVPIPANDGTEIIAGLHPLAGGNGSEACSGDMLLQALVTCAGTTMAVVATALGLEIREAHIDAIGSMDFRGTLGVVRTVPVGFTSIALRFYITSDVPAEHLDKLIQLTERYCVVLQTLLHAVPVSTIRVT